MRRREGGGSSSRNASSRRLLAFFSGAGGGADVATGFGAAAGRAPAGAAKSPANGSPGSADARDFDRATPPPPALRPRALRPVLSATPLEKRACSSSAPT